MKILAIGSTGFIGQHVVLQLVEAGHDVAVLHRGTTQASLPNEVRHFPGDRNHRSDVHGALQTFAPDVVLDVILYTEKQARELVEACRGSSGRVVALSSADVYRNYDGLRGAGSDAPDPPPLSEDAPCRRSRYPYRGTAAEFEYAEDYEKILVEQALLRDVDVPATVLRLPAVYGPDDRQHRLRSYLQQMARGVSHILLQQEQADWRWTRGYVENVAAAVVLAITAGDSVGGRIYNVGDEPVLTEREWVDAIGAAAGWHGEVTPVPIDRVPDPFKQQLDWRYSLWTDTTRIRQELGYTERVGLNDALARSVEWERSTMPVR